MLLSAAQLPAYKHLVQQAAKHAQTFPEDQRVGEMMDRLMVAFGAEILKIVPGRVSTEVDAKYAHCPPPAPNPVG